MALKEVDESKLEDIAGEAIELSRKNQEYFHEHADEIREEYGGCTVAIIDQQIVASVEGNGDHLTTRLINQLRHEYEKKQLAESYITYVSADDDMLIL